MENNSKAELEMIISFLAKVSAIDTMNLIESLKSQMIDSSSSSEPEVSKSEEIHGVKSENFEIAEHQKSAFLDD